MNTNRANRDQSNRDQSNRDQSNRDQSLEGMEAGLEHVLRNFRSSVHTWSEAEMSRPRMVPTAHRHTWRFAATWALGCLLAAGGLSAGLYQHQRNQIMDRMAYQPPVQQVQPVQREQLQTHPAAVSAQVGQGDESLMADVDSDVSRPVPSAMEPLAQLMDEGGNQ